MQLITIFNLATLNERELRVLFRKVSQDMARADLPAEDRRIAWLSLSNIARAIRGRNSFEP